MEHSDHHLTPHDRRRKRTIFEQAWDWLRSGFTLATLIALILFGIRAIRAHAHWMDTIQQIAAKQLEIDEKWHPQIVNNTNDINVIKDDIKDIKTDVSDIQQMFTQYLMKMKIKKTEGPSSQEGDTAMLGLGAGG